MDNNKSSDFKTFFIKLISIALAIIVVVNVLFNLIVADKIKHLDTLLSLSELENRRGYGIQLRNNLINLNKKEQIIKKEDKIILYNLYKKLKSEFENIK
tara:strand:- start:505 stop:801 length:297 start_codon:yes stop_codon:yes gene_type:complete